MIQVARKSK